MTNMIEKVRNFFHIVKFDTRLKKFDFDGQITTDEIRARDGDGLKLYDDSGNGIFVNDGGIVDMAKQSGCRVYISTDQSIPSNSAEKVEFDSEDFDIQNEFNTSTNRFTVTKNGTYVIIISNNYKGTADQSLHDIRLRKNGADIFYRSLYSSGSGSFATVASSVVDLDASDYIELFVVQTTGITQDLRGGTLHTYMNIQKIA